MDEVFGRVSAEGEDEKENNGDEKFLAGEGRPTTSGKKEGLRA